MHYRTVFDVAQNGFQGWLFLLFVIGGMLFTLVGTALKSSDDADFRTKGRLFQLFGIVFAVVGLSFGVSSYLEFSRFERALTKHRCSVVEGVVTDFVPMPPGGHSTESFNVNGTHFEYSGGWGSTSFNSEWNKGYIHNGTRVRITYTGTDILRVETQ